MANNKYKIAVVQLNLNDVAENNLKKCLSWVREAAKMGAEVISLPELYSSHYFCQSEDVDNFALAEPLYSTSFIAFSALAKELKVVIIVPFLKKEWLEFTITAPILLIPMDQRLDCTEKCTFQMILIFMKNSTLPQAI